ncbi:MAG TPA: hypothetical protein VJ997_14985 [Longimicrobiales bacterium]|nr:hypothetical protein [Longimicrobiales bacterium]
MRRRTVLAGLIGAALTGWIPAPARGQDRGTDAADRAAVLATVQAFFASMTAKDVAGAAAVLEPQGRGAPGALLFGTHRPRRGQGGARRVLARSAG